MAENLRTNGSLSYGWSAEETWTIKKSQWKGGFPEENKLRVSNVWNILVTNKHFWKDYSVTVFIHLFSFLLYKLQNHY